MAENIYRKRLHTLANCHNVAVHLFERGDLSIAVVLVEWSIQQLDRTLEEIKREDRQNQLFVDVLMEKHMQGFKADISLSSKLRQAAEGDEKTLNRGELVKLIDRVARYHAAVSRGVRFLYPHKGAWSLFREFSARYRKKIAGTLAIVFIGVAGWGAVSLINRRCYSLHCDYFTDQKLTEFYKRVRATTIDHNWGTGAPFWGFKTDAFSVRWSGYLYAPVSGDYELAVESDDGAVLWLDDRKIIEDWTSRSATLLKGNAYLEAGCHPLRLDYFENNAAASVRFLWKIPNETLLSVVPTRAFRSDEKYCKEK